MRNIITHFIEIFEYRDMANGLVKRDLRGRYKGSLLGFMWNLLNPMCQILVYIVIFSYVFRSGIDNYPIYLIVGMMPWNFFAESIKEGAGSIIHQADLTKKIFFPREILIISTVSSRLVNFLITYLVVIGIILISGFGIVPLKLILIPIATVILYVFSLGLALILSAVDVYFRDIEHITGVLLMAWVWGTPIMYNKSATGTGVLGKLIDINPMTWYIELFQDILYYKTTPDIKVWFGCGVLALLCLAVGEIVFTRLEKNFAEEL